MPGYPPYAGVAVPTAPEGDAAARLRLRLADIDIACAALPAMLAALPDGPVSVGQPLASGEGFGVAEGARGDCWCWLRLDNGLISAAFLADPGWRAWATIEAILPGAALSDVPLIIRSIGAGNSGVDL